MPTVKAKEGESFEQVIRRFKKQYEKAGILTEIRKREHYEKPSVKRKKKSASARKRSTKKSGPSSSAGPLTRFKNKDSAIGF